MYNRSNIVNVSALFFIFISACTTDISGDTLQMNAKMTVTPTKFETAPIGSLKKSACSPDMPDYPGLAIAAPDVMTLGDEALKIFAICGAFSVPLGQALSGDPMMIELKNQDTGTTETLYPLSAEDENAMENLDFNLPTDAVELSPEAIANTMSSGYFHINLQDHRDLLLAPGQYRLRVNHVGDISNTLTFEIRP